MATKPAYTGLQLGDVILLDEEKDDDDLLLPRRMRQAALDVCYEMIVVRDTLKYDLKLK